MSSLIRAPKVNGQPRVLAVEKSSPVFRAQNNKRDTDIIDGNKNKHNSNADLQADELDLTPLTANDVLEEDGVNSNAKSDEFPAYDNMPKSYYSTEVATQVSETTAKLAAATEELDALKASVQEKRDAAQQEGYDQGYKQGLEEAERVIFERLQRFDDLERSITEKINDTVSENEDMLVEIAFAALVKMLGPILPTKEGALEAVRQAAKSVTKRDKMLIRVSERDYQLLKDSRSELVKNSDDTEIQIVSDPHVELGGCILETSAGSLDSRLEIQLANLVDTLKSVNDKHRMNNT